MSGGSRLPAPRRLVADANVFVAAFLKDSAVRRIVALSGLQLLVPEYLFEEVRRHLDELSERAGLQKGEASELLGRLGKYFIVLPQAILSARLNEAEKTMAGIDSRDAVYLAMALAVPCDGIWSDDPHMKMQKRVKCFTTRELVAELKADGFQV